MGSALSNDSGHFSFLQNALDYLSKLTIPSGKSLPCIRGWIISIKSLLSLWTELNTKHGFSHLFTSQLNQDCAENLFSIIRGKGGNRDNPDAREFRAAYRQVLFDQMLMPSPGSNCELDADSILLSLTNLASNEKSATRSTNEDMSAEPQPPNLTSCRITLPLQNVQAYMAGYLLRKSEITNCSQCKLQCQYDKPPHTDLYILLREKSYAGKENLFYPTEPFVKLVENWESKFQQNIDDVVHMNGILGRLFRLAKSLCDSFLVCSGPMCELRLLAMLKLYMKIRLHSVIKRANKAMSKTKPGKQNRKLLKLQHL